MQKDFLVLPKILVLLYVWYLRVDVQMPQHKTGDNVELVTLPLHYSNSEDGAEIAPVQ